MNLLPIGSVITVNEHKLSIIGYSNVKSEDKGKVGYYVVPYPVGYIGIEKTFFVPFDIEMTVLSEGYRTEATDALLKLLGDSLEMTKDMHSDTVEKLLSVYKKAIDNATEGK